jgi:hypothetical protein
MRNVLRNHSEVAHYWANQVQPHGKAGNMFFERGIIYSYGRHFAIARHIAPGVIAFTTEGYSRSTAKHKSIVRSAARHLRTVYCADPEGAAGTNKGRAEEAIKAALLAAEMPRIRQATRDGHKARALLIAEQFNEYLAALPEDERGEIAPFDVSGFDELRARLVQVEAERQERAEAARKRELEAARERLEQWRAGGPAIMLHSLPPALRLADRGFGVIVQTSHGAEIPIEAARKLWPMVSLCKDNGRGIAGQSIALGKYSLKEIRGNGSIVVGCHDIAYSEIEGIARQLGLIGATEAAH